jgi:hypothetical protein
MRRSYGIVAIVALAACGANEGRPDDGAGGKADDPDDEPTGATLHYKSYDVVFTNPLCRDYAYDAPVASADGSTMLRQKPRNVWCTKASDWTPSASRPTSAQSRLVAWVDSLGAGDEVFFAFLSFSNTAVKDALCGAAMRGAHVTFLLDAPTSSSAALAACGATVGLRGHDGGIGYAHNKIVLVNPAGPGPGDDDPAVMRLMFGSGNMSSGLVLHHENWHFIEVNRDSYFAEAHRCLMNAMLDEDSASSVTKYGAALNACRAEIAFPQEDDLRGYFIPSRDDSERITQRMLNGVREAAAIDLGAHRFGHPELMDTLADRLASDETFTARMVADDDLYWLRPLVGPPRQTGDNQQFEASNVERMEEAGGDRFEIRYLETNHGEHLLHHNKYIVFHDLGGREELLCGAANLTDTGFSENFENIYYVTIPAVVEQFETQFARVWEGRKATPEEQDPPLATPKGMMPADDMPVH